MIVLQEIAIAKDRNTQWKLSFYDWSNSVNHVYHNLEGETPSNGWEKFKSKYKIIETVKFEETH